MTGHWIAAAAVALCACGGTLFVDPNPPRLRRAVAQYTTRASAEPLIYVPLIDLYIEDPNTCVFAKSWFLDAAQKAMQAATPNLLGLATQDLAPDCTQREGVALDVDGIVRDLRLLAANNPQAHLRLVILYANNLALPLPAARSQSLSTLSAKLTALQGMPPLLWLVGSKVLARQLASDTALDWTYAGDPAMVTALHSATQLSLPLQTEVGTVSQQQPLLSGADLVRAQEIKLCGLDPEATVTGLPAPGLSARLDRAAPPAWQITLPPQLAASKALFSPHTVVAKVELCDGNCDRYYRVDPDQLQRGWDTINGCLLGGSK